MIEGQLLETWRSWLGTILQLPHVGGWQCDSLMTSILFVVIIAPVLQHQAFSKVGTPLYMSPEVQSAL
eukprot:4928072-Amphidinium_carterae.3